MLYKLQTYALMYATITLAELDKTLDYFSYSVRLNELEQRLKVIEADYYSEYGNRPKHGFKRR